jgi:hypothetical protein
MTDEEIEIAKKEIDEMTHVEMATTYRFAPAGHRYFNFTNKDLPDYFMKRFKELGGMTSEISKQIGLV